MDRIISFLLFAGFFYLMMRFGCGAHAVHGHHHDDTKRGTGPDAGKKSSDPVCGMDMEAGRGYAEVFEGLEYRFCSRKCLDKFDLNHEQFAHA